MTEQRRAELDSLLVTNDEIGMARLRWLNTGPTEASAVAVKTEVRKLLFLRGLDARTLDLSTLPAERRRFLAAVAPLPRRYSQRRTAHSDGPLDRPPLACQCRSLAGVHVWRVAGEWGPAGTLPMKSAAPGSRRPFAIDPLAASGVRRWACARGRWWWSGWAATRFGGR